MRRTRTTCSPQVIQLAERASSDGLSINLWLRFIRLTAQLYTPHLLPAIDRASEGNMNGHSAASTVQMSATEVSIGVEKVRAAFERALTACGLHMRDGSRIWDAYEAVEAALLCLIRCGALVAAGESGERTSAESAQRVRIRKLWRRRLAVPQFAMEAAHERYVEFKSEATHVEGQTSDSTEITDRETEQTERCFQEASKAANARRQFELRIASAAGSSRATSDPWGNAGTSEQIGGAEWVAWEAYLDFEGTAARGGADPWRVRMLFERMLTPASDAWEQAENVAKEHASRLEAYVNHHANVDDSSAGATDDEPMPFPEPDVSSLPFCARPAVWHRYVRYLSCHLPSPTLRMDVTARAVRCCASDSWLWIERLRAMEEGNASAEDVQSTFEAALFALSGADALAVFQTGWDAAAPTNRAPPPHGGYANDHLWLLHAYSQYQRRRLHASSVASTSAVEDGTRAAARGPEHVLIASVREARDAVLAYEAAYLASIDVDCSLIRFWCAVEVHDMRDEAQARVLMESAIARCGGGAAIWIDFASMEREVEMRARGRDAYEQLGCTPRTQDSFERCRKVFRRAVTVVHTPDHAQAVHTAWLDFEAKFGSVGSLRAAEDRIASHRAQLGRRHTKEEEAAAQAATAAAAARALREQKRTAARKEKRKEKRAATHEAGAGADDPSVAMTLATAGSKGGNGSTGAQMSGSKRSAETAGLGAKTKARDGSEKIAYGTPTGGGAREKKPRSVLQVPRSASTARSTGVLVPRAARSGAVPAPRPRKTGLGLKSSACAAATSTPGVVQPSLEATSPAPATQADELVPARASASSANDAMLSNAAFREMLKKA